MIEVVTLLLQGTFKISGIVGAHPGRLAGSSPADLTVGFSARFTLRIRSSLSQPICRSGVRPLMPGFLSRSIVSTLLIQFLCGNQLRMFFPCKAA